jgi:hypothetical protein
MRTTIDIPDALYRELKAKAALEGLPMKDLVRRLVEHGLGLPLAGQGVSARSAVPSFSVGRPLPVGHLGNAALFELLDDET